MFTALAIGLLVVATWHATRGNEADRKTYDALGADDRVWLVQLHARQDLKLIAISLAAILVMLGVIADRIG